MRSRYSAWVLADDSYLRSSWHPQTCPAEIDVDPRQRWLGLRIRACAAGGPDDDLGTVEFVARYKIDGRGHRLHELSEFVRHQGRWVYLRGLGPASTSSSASASVSESESESEPGT